MRRQTLLSFTLVAVVCGSILSLAEQKPAKKSTKPATHAQPSGTGKAPAPKPASPAAKNTTDGGTLESVLTQLDRASENFHSCEADFVWEQYQKVVDERDIQKGKVYFLHHDKGLHMAADVQEPEKKYLLFSEGKVRLYQPKIEQVTEYEVGKKKAEFESFLVLGFGGRGHDLPSAFNVKYEGAETIGNVKVVKLDLVPKSDKVHNMFEHITIWVDPTQDVSLKQQFFEPSGDYRTATYSNFKMNQKLNDDIFKLKTTSRTKVVKPQ
jgi:outer membrane lipoprotein-sorting protein